jgi:hypothetical protein
MSWKFVNLEKSSAIAQHGVLKFNETRSYQKEYAREGLHLGQGLNPVEGGGEIKGSRTTITRYIGSVVPLIRLTLHAHAFLSKELFNFLSLPCAVAYGCHEER